MVIYVRVAIEVELMMIVIDVIVIMVHPIKPRRLELRHEATVPCSDKYSVADTRIRTKAWDERAQGLFYIVCTSCAESAQYVQKIINKKSTIPFPSNHVLPPKKFRLQVIRNGRHALYRVERPRCVLTDLLHVADVFGQVLASICCELPFCVCQTQAFRATNLE
jgi:hypothetical protein